MSAARRRIVLGVTGSIAAYKTPQLVRDLLRNGDEVRVAMTRSATAFVTPLTLSTVSRNTVVIDPLPTDAGAPNAGTWHIDLAHWGDAMLIAPASANTIAKLAHGRADSSVTMLALAFPATVIIAPAMDDDMWTNKATQDNLNVLRSRGTYVIDPASGSLASGREGEGRLPESDVIVAFLNSIFEKHNSLKGFKIVVTAGPTQEPIDPVRYIGNRSSGTMGYAIASEAARRGASVTLVSGPTALDTPQHVKRVDVNSSGEMFDATLRAVQSSHALIMAAAVADYAPIKQVTSKLKKTQTSLTLELKPTVDILKSLVKSKGKRIHIGFALETNNGIANAKTKLKEKHLDCIVLNAATGKDASIGENESTITLIDRNGDVLRLPRMSKRECANHIVDRLATLMARRKK